MSSVYLLHLDRPFSHARHYVGMSYDSNPLPRIEAHRAGKSRVKFISAVIKAGIGFRIARVWYGAARPFEKKIKTAGGLWKVTNLCPICSGDSAWGLAVWRPNRRAVECKADQQIFKSIADAPVDSPSRLAHLALY